MIRITCTHCRQILTIDDGFAGGVCRCQHCGTIQTVPSTPSKAQGRGAVPTPAAKTLYRGHRKEEQLPDDSHHGSGSGLDQLAEIVSSSGLSSNSRRLRSQPGNGSPVPAIPDKAISGRVLIALVIAALLILAIIALLVLRGSVNHSQTSTPPPNSPPAAQTPAPNTIAGPNFAGMPVKAQDTVIYLLDDGGSSSDILPAMQSAIYQSIQSLGNERRFKVILWRDGAAYPPEGTSKATPDELAKCQTALRDAFGQGNTQVDAAMKSAMAEQPDAIILFTAKAAQLTDDFAQTVLNLRADSQARIYAVAVNGDSSIDPAKPGVMATLAAKTNGGFLNLSSADLIRLGH